MKNVMILSRALTFGGAERAAAALAGYMANECNCILVVIDDDMPVTTVGTGTGATKQYTTYVFGQGAFEFTNCGAKVPFEMYRDPSTNGGQDTLYSRQRKCWAPYGISFTQASMSTLSPTNAELANGANWELVNSGQSGTGITKEYINHKVIPISRIISLG